MGVDVNYSDVSQFQATGRMRNREGTRAYATQWRHLWAQCVQVCLLCGSDVECCVGARIMS